MASEAELLSEQPEWADLAPIPQREGVEPVVQIMYDKDYSDAMGLLRALMLKGELSERALHLTSVVIFMNSAHVTVWEFRRCVLSSLNSKMRWLAELEFMHEVNEMNTKNYQLWNHRRAVLQVILPTTPVERERNSSLRADTMVSDHTLEKELAHLSAVFEADSKHYHAWAHRQWVVGRHKCWATEMELTKAMIARDVYNNSAWNHRFFVLENRTDRREGGDKGGGGGREESEFTLEVLHAVQCLERAPENESAWTFLTGFLFKSPHFLSVSAKEYSLVVELLTKFCKVQAMAGGRKGGSSSAAGGVKCVSFEANILYLLALRLSGLEDEGLPLWGDLAPDLDPRAQAQAAIAKWEALKGMDAVRRAAYGMKIRIAEERILGSKSL
ncbi:protein prenylyltransferase [Chloropicon primus]|uniref:Protein farnesyltransferase/geranylgeranyltransferase type-1 subunit alpha n=1 Tax=Chloropicon primus TaxID=1764295 RepID=A0A5B8MKK7_9CHLO|nr:protein prenylyltransferase [Chloropicon primus]UPQ99113.1 protein prenylyltransferase [Chloropicon primus]|mmetsp:Transcript_13518/g.37968  ORF Transcript_13518/g.37968 Transcript_13518/m.37968 type:complete len:386 (-) Transcript_13518:3430-4587(-)|eukprot:QDZ19902.1 protein prenylyltransferase [Chloropicon primus]